MDQKSEELETYSQFVNNANNLLEPELAAVDDQGVFINEEEEGNFDSDGSLYLDSSYYTEDEDDSFIDYFLYENAAMAA